MSYLRPSGQGINVTGPEVEWDNKNGWRSTWHYEGTADEVAAQRIIEISSGATMVRQGPSGNGLYELHASYPTDETGDPLTDEPQDIHELEVQVEQIPVWNSETLRAQFSGTQDEIDAAIGMTQAYWNKFQSGGITDENGDPDITEALSKLLFNVATNPAACGKLFRLVARGTDSAIEYNTVYRRTLTAADPAQVTASIEGVRKIWTTAEVENWEGTPAAPWFGLEPGMQWLKAPPTVQAVSGQRTQIQYYYTQFKQASAMLYTAYGSAVLFTS